TRPDICDSLSSGQPLYLLNSNAWPPAALVIEQAIGRLRLQVTGSAPTGIAFFALCANVWPPNGASAAAPANSIRRLRWLTIPNPGFSVFMARPFMSGVGSDHRSHPREL